MDYAPHMILTHLIIIYLTIFSTAITLNIHISVRPSDSKETQHISEYESLRTPILQQNNDIEGNIICLWLYKIMVGKF